MKSYREFVRNINEGAGPVTDEELKHHVDHPELDGHKEVEQHPFFKKHFKDATYKMVKSGGNYHRWSKDSDSLHYHSVPRWAEATMYHEDKKNPSDHFAIKGSGANHKEAMDDLEKQIKGRQK